MLAYRHLFHAGNFADVFKHAILARLLLALRRKDKGFCYVETHAGIGLYDLTHPWAQKLGEYRDGVARVWQRDDAPASMATYLDIVRRHNADGKLRWYPGSPCIASALLRTQDRAELAELNRDDSQALARRLQREKRMHVHCMDGYQALKAFLPPQERRGLVLIDSSFDRAREFDRLVDALKAANERWATGIFALWYPLMEPVAMRGFERHAAGSGIRKILRLELNVLPEGWADSLRGCGMLIVNPPFSLQDEAREILGWLAPILGQMQPGSSRIDWLVPE